jgi:two-component system, LytTR family, response regulator
MYKVIIIEDDFELAQTLAKIISIEAPLFELVGIAGSILEGEKLIADVNPDVAFFDVELKDGLSFELLEKIQKIDFEIIFVTAYSQYAINAFHYSAIDFVLKPVDPDDIRRASERAVESISKKNIDERIKNMLFNRNQEPVEHRIILQTAGSVHFVRVKDIIRCESDVNYTTFYLSDGKSIMVSKTMGEFERLLPPFFFRAHRSHLINLNYVVEVKKRSGIAILSNKEKIEISFRKKDAFLQALKDFCS